MFPSWSYSWRNVYGDWSDNCSKQTQLKCYAYVITKAFICGGHLVAEKSKMDRQQGAMKMTPTNALDEALDMPSLYLLVMYKAETTANS